MKYGLILSLLITIPCMGQTNTTGESKTSGPCSPAVSGSKNTFTIECGISQKQGQKILDIVNKILANQMDTEAVMKKLDEVLEAINPNVPVITYSCNGTWRSVGPSASAGVEVGRGGDDTAFRDMLRLVNAHKYADLLKLCQSQIELNPAWLTPRLFCGLAYLGTGDRAKAKEMVAEYDAKAGPAYDDIDACDEMSDLLHKALR